MITSKGEMSSEPGSTWIELLEEKREKVSRNLETSRFVKGQTENDAKNQPETLQRIKKLRDQSDHVSQRSGRDCGDVTPREQRNHFHIHNRMMENNTKQENLRRQGTKLKYSIMQIQKKGTLRLTVFSLWKLITRDP